MGRARQKYKPKPKFAIDDSEQKKIKVDFEDDKTDKYDESNVRVLPSEKRKTKKLRDKNAAPVKLLSKRKRKHLEKIVDQKTKKAKHAELVAALEKVQASPKDLSLMTQLQTTQTLGRKKFLSENFMTHAAKEVEDGRPVSSIKGRKRKRKAQDDNQEESHDPRIVKLEELSSSDESDDQEYNGNVSSIEEKAIVGEIVSEKSSVSGKDMAHIEVKEEVEVKESSELVISQGSTEAEKMEKPQEAPSKPAVYVALNRPKDIQTARLKLPILAEEQGVMEAISENPVTVIVGATGSGKTTQVPQFLYEAGYASDGKMIGITEPRRVAAISMSQRVAYEMNLTSKEVSYQIRFEGNTTPHTKMKFMTDGVLLKEIQMDPSLKKYSVIIIDEAHERSVFSDILIGILSRIILRRQAKGKPLKLIIMSATLRVEDFTENLKLFKEIKLPVMKVETRMFDVTIHFNKRTEDDYVGEAFKKACKIHRQLPEGGILIFLTGQLEVNTVVRKLRTAFPMFPGKTGKGQSEVSEYRRRRLEVKELKKAKKQQQVSPTKKIALPDVKLEDFVSALPDDAEGDLGEDAFDGDRGIADIDDSDLDLEDEEDELMKDHKNHPGIGSGPEQPMWVLPLYSMLPPEKQRIVFQPPPEGTRLCVVATNVAETSLTIPNVKYVVDTGKVKEKVYDKVTGVSMFHVTWTSQASANQRAGRAGRTSAGHCYRLYSSAVFNDEFQKFSQAEIQRRPIDDLVLIMKAMNLPVINFPFPTPPDYIQVRQGIKRLSILGALEEKLDKNLEPLNKKKRTHIQAKDRSCITSIGKAMAAFPLAPRYGKMLVLSHQHSLLPYTVALVAALTVHEVLIETPLHSKENSNDTRKRWQDLRLKWAGKSNSRMLGDIMVLLRAVGAAEFQGEGREWCDRNGLRYKAIIEIRKLRRQLTNEINLIIPSCNLILDPQMQPPTDDQARLLRQVVLAGSVDHVARRVDDCEIKNPHDKAKWKHAYRTQEMEEPVFLPTSSVLRADMPQWVVYQDIYETHKMFMRNVTAIEPEWLAVFAPQLCTFSQPLESPEPSYDADLDKVMCHRTATFGPESWQIPEVEVQYPSGQNLFRWVAYFFMMGDLCPLLKPYVEYIYEPRTLVNPVAIRYRVQRESLLRALMSQDITSFAQLKGVWKKDSKYLKREYLQWIENTEIRSEVSRLWPPIPSDQETAWC